MMYAFIGAAVVLLGVALFGFYEMNRINKKMKDYQRKSFLSE